MKKRERNKQRKNNKIKKRERDKDRNGLKNK